MFSPNPYTRHRQQKATALFVASGVLAAVSVSHSLLPADQPVPVAYPLVSSASFGRVALSHDGTRQVEFSGQRVVFRDRTTQQPLALYNFNNIQGVRFTPDGNDVLIHVLRTRRAPGTELALLSDDILVLDPATGKVKDDGPYTLTR